MKTKPRVLGVSAAARAVGLSPRRLRAALVAGQIPGLSLGRRWYVDVGVLEQRLGRSA